MIDAGTLKAAALAYAARGWPVFPVQPREKKPLTDHGFKDATADATVIDRWWTKAPDANIGFVPGRAGFVVIDIDGPEGERAAQQLGIDPATVLPRVRTGRAEGGGVHLYFRHPGFEVRNQKLTPKLEARGDVGYVILPPSVHPSGAQYRWEGEVEDAGPLAPRIVDRLRGNSRPEPKGADPSEAIPEGERNNRLASRAGSMRRRGASPESILAALLKENAARCTPPLPEEEVERIARSVGRYPPAADSTAGRTDKTTQAQLLVDLADAVTLFHAPDGTAYATLAVEQHQETHAVRHQGFRRWLVNEFFLQQNKPPSAQSLHDALALLEARAHFDGPERAVWLRTAAANGLIYIDLGDPQWRSVEVAATGWRVVDRAPVCFRRAPGSLALPDPTRTGSLADLRRFVNVEDDADFQLLVAWIIASLRPVGPYPILGLSGEQGSAKTVTSRVTRSLVDPASLGLRATPHNERDLMIGVNNSWALAFDNLSDIRPWLSDALCRIATGSGYSTRQLYTDSGEVIFGGQRPILLNGIAEVADKADLRDRTLFLTLPPIPDRKRRDEEEFWARWVDAAPGVLGAVLNGVVAGLANLATTHLTEKPRMADFARWVTACEPGLGWEARTLLRVYAGNRVAAVEQYAENEAWLMAVRAVIDAGPFDGRIGELLAETNRRHPESTRPKDKDAWPISPRAASAQLRRAAPVLRQLGYGVTFGKRRRLLHLHAPGVPEKSPPEQDQQDQQANPNGGGPKSPSGPEDGLAGLRDRTADRTPTGRPERTAVPEEDLSVLSDGLGGGLSSPGSDDPGGVIGDDEDGAPEAGDDELPLL